MESPDACSTRLCLGLGRTSTGQSTFQRVAPSDRDDADHLLLPSLSLGLFGEATNYQSTASIPNRATTDKQLSLVESTNMHLQREVSSIFNNSSSGTKRSEREPESGALEKTAMVSGEEEEDCSSSTPRRKKLRLSKEQVSILEGSFKSRTTLNPNQKEDLARRLCLRPRQVEVWFQNRRARIKSKQTEVECETLKRRCETLMEENMRLQEQVQELKLLSTARQAAMMPPFLAQIQTPFIACPSCGKSAESGGSFPSTTPFSVSTPKSGRRLSEPSTPH
ncbi:hypothetical protein SAY87_014924 [Trapa incisa]|uniref:Homeobox domain-containing protein n=1 Tax=Trapa incisa TaxID=236973 RepID=A0AAN7GWD0_9MYRT|nr:hypothetical protein SAY87_014924 [Trapa incisa]